ncbi:hypothetical protein [Massilia niastensis]|uniref:hypothetical protein n=1 Tax=Massilia niastensis TaxID=544911 RepID=UPI00036D1DC8|nr:hypothetical protein [Massilia niastensis]
MIELSSPRWHELQHAYGKATDIPGLLAQLQDLPDGEGDAEPWFSLWSALAHQGDVYPASFAAVPHVIDALSRSPETAGEVYFHFPAWVDICRHKNQVEIPADLRQSYVDAMSRLPGLLAQASGRPWDTAFAACALAATAAAKGQPQLAEVLLEMSSPEAVNEFLEWSYER